MQLGRYQVSTLRPPPILGVTFSHDGRIFAVATESGYEVWRTWPMGLLRRRGEFDRGLEDGSERGGAWARKARNRNKNGNKKAGGIEDRGRRRADAEERE
jgi:hypothetical protein